MLVLTRRQNETIVIDGNIRIQVISISGNRVRIGVDAPKEIIVNREEIHNYRMQFEKLEDLEGCNCVENSYVI